MNMTEAEKYELFVGQLYRWQMASRPDNLYPSADLLHRATYRGVHTGNTYEIDLSFTVEIGGLRMLVIFECKHYRRRVGKEIIQQLHSTMSDIGAHKGIVVTTTGFQKGALKAAQAYGIALVIASIDPKWFDSPGEVSMFNPKWHFVGHGHCFVSFSGPHALVSEGLTRWLTLRLVESMLLEAGYFAGRFDPNYLRTHQDPNLPFSVQQFVTDEQDSDPNDVIGIRDV